MTEILVSTDWVAENLENETVRLIEVDVDTNAYSEGHIPGAVGFNWQSQLQDQVNRDILTQAEFNRLLSEAGVTADTSVILYGDNHNWFAAYALWLFKYYGHDDVRLMDGGRAKWLAEGRSITTDIPQYAATNYQSNSVNPELRADRDYIRARLETVGFGLVDVRSPAEFVGDIIAPPGMSETAQRPGHIPGASNIPWSQAVAEDGTFKSREELEELYAAQGINGTNREIIAYCRIGERSSHSWVALKYILGYDNVRNYDGSWTEWGNLIGNPIRLGSER